MIPLWLFVMIFVCVFAGFAAGWYVRGQQEER